MRTQHTNGKGTKKKSPMRNAFMGAFPDYTPEQAAQAKMERVYGKGFQLPYDDDGQEEIQRKWYGVIQGQDGRVWKKDGYEGYALDEGVC